MTRIPPPDELGAATITTREEAIAYLMGRINYERTGVVPYGQRQLKLDRMRQLLVRLGNPDAGMPIVHIAGTKGKGSTAAMVANGMHAAGYDTGLFSSPHLERIEERFAVNGQPCAGDELVALVEQLRPIVQVMDAEAKQQDTGISGPTYFELTTAIALMHFAQRKVDIAVLEVGMGGRLDSTNVCQPAVTVITSISLDHTKQLGTTHAAIAAEKSGIIKPGVPLLYGPMEPEARQVIDSVAAQHGCRVLASGRDFSFAYRPPQQLDRRAAWGKLDVELQFGDEPISLKGLPLQLLGGHQAANAALAVAVLIELRQQGWLTSTEAIHKGLQSTSLSGRIEIVRRRPTVVIDVAHNVAAAQALVEVLQTSFAINQRMLLLAATRDKDVRGIIQTLLPHFAKVVVTEYQENSRAVKTERLSEMVREELRAMGRSDSDLRAIADPRAALDYALQQAEPDQLVCITGSFFIVSELRPALLATV